MELPGLRVRSRYSSFDVYRWYRDVLQVQKEHLAASGALLVSGAHTSGAHGDDGVAVGRIADLLRVRGI